MRFRVEYTLKAFKQLKKLDKKIAALIIAFIEERLVNCENPRLFGKALRGDLNDTWRYRVGNYRLLAKIQDAVVLITIVEVGHRREIDDRIRD
jgi:mRNA interferase RelE/StbE